MAFVRWILGSIILFLDALIAPTPAVRSPEDQRRLQEKVANLAIYQYEACPFCVKVRRFLKGANLAIPLYDAKREPYRSELLAGGGKLQVPCLKITEGAGSVRWLYESSDIIAYLRDRL